MKLEHRCVKCDATIIHKKNCSSHTPETEQRKAVEGVAKIARDAMVATLPKDWRAVVVVTDFEGSFIAVASTTYEADTKQILTCSQRGDDYKCSGEAYSVRGEYDEVPAK